MPDLQHVILAPCEQVAYLRRQHCLLATLNILCFLSQAQEQAVVGSKGPMVQHRDDQGLQEAAQRQAALSACGQELLRSLKRALDLALLCMKTMSDAAEDLSCATQNGGQVTAFPQRAIELPLHFL